MAKNSDQWLSMYAETHRNPLNKKLHMICVPAIFWTVLALAWSLPVPATIRSPHVLNWATLLSAFIMLFYATLGLRQLIGMAVLAAIALTLSAAIEAYCGTTVLASLAGTVFIFAWIGQFYGHKIEGKKPAFFEDILFLLIGPLWIMENLLKRDTR